MRLQRVAKSFGNPDYVFELKRDGFRAIAYIEDHKCKLVSGNQNHFNFLFLTVALGKLPVEKAILDGEVICLVLWKSTAQGIEVLHNLFAQVVFLQMR